MFTATIVGNLGASAPEKKTGKTGTPHYYWTVAINEMNNGQQVDTCKLIQIFIFK